MSTKISPKSLLKKLISKQDLTEPEISNLFDMILEGKIDDVSVGALLVALSMKTETSSEIASAIRTIQKHAVNINPKVSGRLVDICGTGGDTIKSFNISTAAAIVAAAAGTHIAKHGNRSFSGYCGSADFFESIGFDLGCPPSKISYAIENTGMSFLFAPLFHPAMKNVATVRKTIGIRTIFNIVGPLCNPCINITGQVTGVSEPHLLETVSEALRKVWLKDKDDGDIMVVHAYDGMDELSNTCENDILWISGQEIKHLRLNPRITGIPVAKVERIIIRSKEESIQDTLQSICGLSTREKEDIVVLNASAALVVGKMASTFKEGVEIARAAIKDGIAEKKLFEIIESCGDKEKLEIIQQKFLNNN